MRQRKSSIYARDSLKSRPFARNTLLKSFELALSQVPRMILAQLDKHECTVLCYLVRKKAHIFITIQACPSTKIDDSSYNSRFNNRNFVFLREKDYSLGVRRCQGGVD